MGNRRGWTVAQLAAVGAVVAIVVAACGGGEATATPQPTATAVRPTPTAQPAATTPPSAPTATTQAPAATAVPSATAQTPAATPTATPAPARTPTPAPAATATASGPQPRFGGVLQVRFYREFTSWDTYHAAGGFSTLFMQNDLSNLIRYTRDSVSKIEGDVAESWDLGPNGKTYTFKLRKDVLWHDGKPLTSADVLYNFKRASDPKFTFNAQRVAPIATMDAPDPSTFRLTLKNTSNSFVANIATVFFLMYPAHITDMEAWQKTSVGSGAFSFKGGVKGGTMEFVKNQKYYGKDVAGRALPYLDGIFYTIIPDPALALAAFRSGRTHCGCTNDTEYIFDNVDTLKKDIPGIKLSEYLNQRISIMFNTRRAPFDNAAFRQGVAIALNKVEAAAPLYRGTAHAPTSPLIAPELGGVWGLPREELGKIPGFNPDHAKDLAIAQQKFKEAGLDSKGMSVGFLGGSFASQAMETSATVLGSEIGLKVRIEITGSVVDGVTRRQQGNFDLYLHTGADTIDDPADQYNSLMLSTSLENYSGYKNPRVDQLLKDQDAELDPAKRRALLWEVQKIQLTDFPYLPLLFSKGIRGTRPEVFGYISGPVNVSSSTRLEGLWLAP